MSRATVGGRGEAMAAALLERSGYRILERNARSALGEVDLVAEEGNVLCFVEVKARTSDAFGSPEEAVTPRKQRQLRKSAEAYLARHGLWDRECRFDVVALVLDGEGRPEKSRLIRGAFEV